MPIMLTLLLGNLFGCAIHTGINYVSYRVRGSPLFPLDRGPHCLQERGGLVAAESGERGLAVLIGPFDDRRYANAFACDSRHCST